VTPAAARDGLSGLCHHGRRCGGLVTHADSLGGSGFAAAEVNMRPHDRLFSGNGRHAMSRNIGGML